ncbi:hypothetical protein ANANG_G00208630 [Anguilla anguilla]|uniref:SNF-related serine/threonine-protein kinase n=1 Tax=Anguilla anguilla TaxID=7936 RepID=A0A9D3M6N0_ANGAN|nr:hypothetical protein ANANG_G00208630 [Anguilla anguilla]
MAASKSGYEGKMAGLYDLDRTLGKGHFAVVKLARHVFTGQLVAVKVIDKTKLDAVATGHLLQEVRCMKLVQHPNVVRLYEVIDTQTRLYLILELADGGDLYDLILRHEGGVGEARAKVHFAQIVRAISYCHRLHVVHRDLKPENVVFFRQQGTVKLTDFGFSNHFQPGTMLMTSCGSLAYSAPEILLGEEYDAPAVDIWSLGVILYMLVCGKPPFQETNDSETLTMIMDCRYTVPPHVSADCKDLIARMLQRDPSRRASLADIEEHPWLRGVDPSPSPAGRASAPLTSHHSLTPEEHQAILQAMSSGNIADRDTIQEALEANQYNHITATYYLLGERLLREKQEQQGQTETDHAPVPNLLQRPVSAPLDLEEGGRRDPLSGAPCRSREEERTFLFERPSSALTLHPAPPSELTPMKTVCALQQIFEEEEEEEEEEEDTQVDLHQQEHRQEDPCQGGGGPTVEVRNLAVDKAETEESGDVERAGLDHQVTEAGGGEGGDLPQTEGAESLNPAEAVEPMPSAGSPQAPPSPGGSPGGPPEGAEPQAVDGDPKSVQEHNNNTLPNPLERSQPAPRPAPRGLPRNHCVDLGPDGVEARPGPRSRPPGTSGARPLRGQRGGPAGREAGPEPAARAERGGGPKNRNVNLRDRLLQFRSARRPCPSTSSPPPRRSSSPSPSTTAATCCRPRPQVRP